MPEGLEAEIWRQAVTSTIGRRITDVWVDSRVSPAGFLDLVSNSTILNIRRAGKILLIDTDRSCVGLHFGMTGRVVVDGVAPIDRLEYSSGRDLFEWDRLCLFTDGETSIPAIRFNDPRRLGHISLDADLSHLGVDIFSVTGNALDAAFARRRSAVKTALLNQTVVAGLGNLCVDEVLWWAGVSPHRPANALDSDETKVLADVTRRRLPIMMRRGGSTKGTLSPEVRAACPPCERDGRPLRRETIGGRTTIWCPEHQC